MFSEVSQAHTQGLHVFSHMWKIAPKDKQKHKKA
jgi:hypothetical protein